MKQFYISTNKTCVLKLIWGWKPQPLINVNKTNGKVHIIHTFAMESLSFSSPLVDKRKKNNMNLLIYVCVWIHKFTFYIFHENNINVSKKVTLNRVKPNVPLFIWNKY
jgi:hypothetical protein